MNAPASHKRHGQSAAVASMQRAVRWLAACTAAESERSRANGGALV
jgi:hypothetical protein